MGGKVWSDEEEQVFWEFIIPQSPCAADPEARHLDWRTCADLMTVRMGEGARRTYTHTMLYEHHYQNFNGPKPRAQKYFEQYQRDVEYYKARAPEKAIRDANVAASATAPRPDHRPLRQKLCGSQGNPLVIRDRPAGGEASQPGRRSSSGRGTPHKASATASTPSGDDKPSAIPPSGRASRRPRHGKASAEPQVFSDQYYQAAVSDRSKSVIPATQDGKGASPTSSSTESSAYPTLPSIPSFYKEMTEQEADLSQFPDYNPWDPRNGNFLAERGPNTPNGMTRIPVYPADEAEEYIASVTVRAENRLERQKELLRRHDQDLAQQDESVDISSDKGKRRQREDTSDDEEPARKRQAPSENDGRDRGTETRNMVEPARQRPYPSEDEEPARNRQSPFEDDGRNGGAETSGMSDMYHPNYAGWKFPFKSDR